MQVNDYMFLDADLLEDTILRATASRPIVEYARRELKELCEVLVSLSPIHWVHLLWQTEEGLRFTRTVYQRPPFGEIVARADSELTKDAGLQASIAYTAYQEAEERLVDHRFFAYQSDEMSFAFQIRKHSR